ncbi:LuxR family transcriptional regulator [Streptomyces sp. NPDC059752]|uniref:helix-turn-helix transcriptional regulator n=1 Tax=unclassified Streptomyces TaxID=2593676 RepID=UPI00365158B6
MEEASSLDSFDSRGPHEEARFGSVHDAFEFELMEVRAIIDFTLTNRRDRRLRNALISEVKPEREAIAGEVRKLIDQASQHVEIILAGEIEISQAVWNVVAGPLRGHGARLDVRVLCTRTALEQQRFEGDGDCNYDCDGETGSLKVRVSDLPRLTAVIVDGRKALVCAESAVGGRASVIQAESVNRTLRMLFESIWQSAAVPSQLSSFGRRDRSDTVRQVLKYLKLGHTDEVAARELSVSVRTYRRYVAEIMTMLGADSRFQAGVRAARLGLLSAAHSTDRDRSKAPPDVPAK